MMNRNANSTASMAAIAIAALLAGFSPAAQSLNVATQGT